MPPRGSNPPKLTTPQTEPRLPQGYEVRYHDPDLLAERVRDVGLVWLARHEENSTCEWFSWAKSLPSATMQCRGHDINCRKKRVPV